MSTSRRPLVLAATNLALSLKLALEPSKRLLPLVPCVRLGIPVRRTRHTLHCRHPTNNNALTDRGSLRSARLYTCRAPLYFGTITAGLAPGSDRPSHPSSCRTDGTPLILAPPVTPHRAAVLALRNPWQALLRSPSSGQQRDSAVNACKAGR